MRRPTNSSSKRLAWLLPGLALALATPILGKFLPLGSVTAAAQTQASPSGQDRIDRPTSAPYTGDLSVFEDPDRDRKLQIGRVMDLLGIKAGSTVADIGAGSGWFSVRAARRVSTQGRVYAEDINPQFLDYIRNRVQKEKLANVQVVLGKSDDPLLPPNSLDAVLLMKSYHEVAEPIQLLRRLRMAMHSEGRLRIIDRNGKGDDHGVNREIVIEEAKRAGFSLAGDYDFVKPDRVDYFLIFQPSARAVR